MSFVSWLRNRPPTHAQRPRAQRCPSAPRFRPHLEALEDRWLPSTLTVTSPKDHGTGTLRAEIAAAQSGATIVFSGKLGGQTITLTTGELDITKNLTIQGPGAGQLTISGNEGNTSSSRVFEVAANATVTLSGLTISNGDAKAAATDPGGTPFDGDGGDILNHGTLTLSGCTISGNSGPYFGAAAELGGGIYNDGTLRLSGCIVSNNSATYDGGGIYNAGTATVSSTTVSGNFVTGDGFVNGLELHGGGIYNAGTLTVSGSVFSGNGPDNIFGPYTDGGGNSFS